MLVPRILCAVFTVSVKNAAQLARTRGECAVTEYIMPLLWHENAHKVVLCEYT